MKIEAVKNINLIVAMTEEGIIGKGNDLPWHISEDLKHFKKTTLSNIILMGRKTFESIGKPLPGRKNFILSSDPEKIPLAVREHEKVYIFSSVEDAVKAASSMPEDLYIIGGASVYKSTIKYANRLYISKVKKNYPGDVYFPEYDKSEWTLIESEDYQDFTLELYERKSF
jgi:dihydrofolate reductase